MTLTSLLAAAVALAGACAAFEMSPLGVFVVGKAAKGEYLWRPDSFVLLNNGSIAGKVSTAGATGCEGVEVAHVGEEFSTCPYAVAYSADWGRTWHIYKGKNAGHFCGAAGVVRDGKLFCAGAALPAADGTPPDVHSRKEYQWEITGTPAAPDTKPESQAALRVTLTDSVVQFSHAGAPSPIVSLIPGGTVLRYDDRSTLLRNAHVSYGNGTAAHAFFKSTDEGTSWQFVSYPPVDFTPHTRLIKSGETRAMLLAGDESNRTSVSSLFLGTRWEKVEQAMFHLAPHLYVSDYNVQIFAGAHPRPKALTVHATTGKKGTAQNFDLVATHNNALEAHKERLAPYGVRAYSDAFGDTIKKPYEKNAEGKDLAPLVTCSATGPADDAMGCATSGLVALVGTGEHSTFVAIYDQTFNGWGPSGIAPAAGGLSALLGGGGGDKTAPAMTVYATIMRVNDTTERAEYEERVVAESKRKENEKQTEADAEALREKMRQKLANSKAETRKKQKERRDAFKAREARFQAQADAYEALDGERIVVRAVDPEYVDIEKDVY